MNVKLSPGVVIEARNRMVAELSEFGGRPIPAATRADIADWLISSGYLAESVVHGGTLPKLIEALQEIHALYCEAVARYQAATGEADNRGREGRSTEAGGE